MASTQHFVINTPISHAWHVGRIIAVSNISRRTPIPEHVLSCAEAYEGPVPSTAIPVDAAACADEQTRASAPPAPTPSFMVAERDVPEVLGVTRDQFNAIRAAGFFPQPADFATTGEVDVTGTIRNPTGSYSRWRRADVLAFLANARTVAAIFGRR